MKTTSFVQKLLALVLGSTSSASAGEASGKLVRYPDLPALSIRVPVEWRIASEERYGIFSPGDKLEVAGTVFRADGKSLEDFTAAKHKAILAQMPWYRPRAARAQRIPGTPRPCYVREYEGLWPEDDKPTAYIVATMQGHEYSLSLTFTAFSGDMEEFRGEIAKILRSVDFQTK